MVFGVPFTVEEDMQLWKFVMEHHERYGGKFNFWKFFTEETGSQRCPRSLSRRFFKILLPRLPNTGFHVETKLELCKAFNVEVGDRFLRRLAKYADVQLNRKRIVSWYQLKPMCPENRDMELDDEAFMRIMLQIVPKRTLFTAEEDAEIWKYAVENYKAYKPGSESFWKKLAQKLDSDLPLGSLRNRFLDQLAPNMHLQDFDIEAKLELYKKCQVAVDENYLKTLKKHAELKIDQDECIVDYKLKAGRAEKRKMPKESDENQKKARVDEAEDDFDNEWAADDSFEMKENFQLDVTLDSEDTDAEDGSFEGADKEETHGDAEEEVKEDDEKNSFDHVDMDKTDESRNLEVNVENQQKPPKVPEVHAVRGDVKEKVMEQKVIRFKTVDECQKTDEYQQKPAKVPEVKSVMKSDQVPDETPVNNNADGRISNKMILEFMQKMENSPKELETVFKREMSEMYKVIASMKDEMKGSRISEASEMKKGMCEMKKDLEASFEKKISEMSKTMDSTKEEVESLRNLIQTEDITGSEKKKGLLNLQKFISSLNAPGLDAIEQRIEAMIQDPSDSDETPIVSAEALKNVLEAMLTLTGY